MLEEKVQEKISQKIKGRLVKHLVDTTGLSLAVTPFFALMETTVRHMSDWESFKTRLWGTGLGYAGNAFLYSGGRDLTRWLFRINDKTNEFIQLAADLAYSAAFNTALHYALYSHTTSQSHAELTLSALTAGGVGAAVGPIGGYAIDLYRDLTGIKPCERKLYPRRLRELDTKGKRKALGYISAALAAATALVYVLTPN